MHTRWVYHTTNSGISWPDGLTAAAGGNHTLLLGSAHKLPTDVMDTEPAAQPTTFDNSSP